MVPTDKDNIAIVEELQLVATVLALCQSIVLVDLIASVPLMG
jgi:hypothetical protein